MLRKFILLNGICWLLVYCLPAQEVQINEPDNLAAMYRSWQSQNRTQPKIEGWRVQIMASTDRLQVEEARNRFRLAYPDVRADWVHEKPYYKLKAGAFRTRLEAMAFVAGLLDFPGSFPVRDAAIHPRDFLE
jgi:hypothetical protein